MARVVGASHPQGGFAGEIALRGEVVYLGSHSGRVYALDASSGAQQWIYDTAAAVAAGPVLNVEGPGFLWLRCGIRAELRRIARMEQDIDETSVESVRIGWWGGVLAPLDEGMSAMRTPMDR